MGKIFNKGLKVEDKKEGRLKRVISIEDKSEKLLKAIEDLGIKQSGSKKADTKNNLFYDSNHNLFKYTLKKFVKISSIESKFDRLEEFYKELISLIFLDAKPEKSDHRFTALNNASNLYNNELIPEYKKVYESEPKDKKDNDWKKKYDPISLKTLAYTPVKSKTK